MGRQAFPIIGGIIGAVVVGIYTGGTGTAQGYAAGFALGSAVGGIAGSYIDPILIQGTTIGDTSLQTASEGGARAIMYGRACVSATCVIARGNRKIVKTKTSNGKGSSGSTENQTVTWTFAIGLGEGMPISAICRIWQDENLVYDVLGDGAISDADNLKFSKKFRYYPGTEDQLPDADLQVFLGEDTPYFRGTAYVVFPNFDLTATAERVPTFKFEIANGVAPIIDELETLGWSIPNNTVHTSSQSVTLTGDGSQVLDVDLFFTTDMEVRKYSDPSVTVVGGGGRFITADSSTAVNVGSDNWSAFNVYKITISNPAQTYYVNNALSTEHVGARLLADGSDQYKLSIQVAGDATITFSAEDVEGFSDYYPQYGTVRAEISGGAVGNTSITLSSIVTDVCERVGMTPDQFDASPLTDELAGVCIQTTVVGTDALNSVVQPFFADPCEKDTVLTWVKRGGDVLRTLTVDDLTEEPDVSSRENTIEYPGKLHFFYQSPLTGYASTKATSYRYSPQVDSSGEGSVTAPVTFYDSDTPAQIAQKLHKVAWTEAEGSFTWTVGAHCIDLVATDVVGLYLRGIATRARITAIANNGDGTLTLTMMKDRQSSYTSNVTGIPLPTPTAPQPTTMSKAVLAVLDIPALTDSDDALIYYTALSGSTSVWKGGQVQRSLDAGATWTVIQDVTSEAVMGRLTVAMGATDREYTDTTNAVTVQLFDNGNELVAYSDTQFLQEQGAVAIQLTDGTWEVLQYRDVVDGGNGLWTLSHLQRGRLNTVAGVHAVGALFVVLDTQLGKQAAQSAWLGGTLYHRGVSYDTSADDATVVTTVYEGLSQTEWSPASATAEFDGTWLYVHDIIPRHRFGTEVNPIASVNFQGYRVTIDGTINDMLTTSAHIATSTASVVTVAELNKITGPGAPMSVIVTTVAAGSLTPEAIVNAGGDA